MYDFCCANSLELGSGLGSNSVPKWDSQGWLTAICCSRISLAEKCACVCICVCRISFSPHPHPQFLLPSKVWDSHCYPAWYHFRICKNPLHIAFLSWSKYGLSASHIFLISFSHILEGGFLTSLPDGKKIATLKVGTIWQILN